MRATATFDVNVFEQQPPYDGDGDVSLARAHIETTFRGDIEGTTTVEVPGATLHGAPAAYVALERVQASRRI